MEFETQNATKKIFKGVFLFVLLVSIDQVVKSLIRQPFRNYRFAFSIPIPENLIYLIYGLVLIGIFFYLYKNFFSLSRLSKIAWILILAGALSNVGERLVLGYVRDFIYIHFYIWTGIYNLADFYIIFAIIILLVCTSKETK